MKQVLHEAIMIRTGNLLIRPQDARVVMNFENHLRVPILQRLAYQRHFLQEWHSHGLVLLCPTGARKSTGECRIPAQNSTGGREQQEEVRCFRGFS